MARRKKFKFSQIEGFLNVIEPSKEIYQKIKGKWSEFFGNTNPIVLELACGYGEYTVGLGEIFPDKNFIGIDIKGERIWMGAKQALKENLTNVAFLRTNIENLTEFFDKQEVSEMWITFPDPQTNKPSRRLTSSRHLQIYRQILKKNSKFYLKTDNTEFFEFSLNQLLEVPIQNLKYTFDLYNSPYLSENYGLKTRYEKKFESNKIKYLSCRFQVEKLI